MSRNFLVPEFWVTAKISGDALRTAIAVGMHASKEGVSFAKNEQLVDMTGKQARQVQLDLSRCEKAGLISKKYDERGRRFFLINRNACTDDVSLRHAQPDCATPRNENAPHGAMALHPLAQSDDTPRRNGIALPPNNPPYRRQSTFQSTIQSTTTALSSSSGEDCRQLEPFESGLVPTSEPIKVRPIETRQPIRFESPDLGELKNKFFEVLGPYAESIHRKISHEMIESGFVAWLLEECKSVDTPFKLFQHKLKTEWQGGNWIRPEELKRQAKAEKLRKHEEFLRSLT